MAICLNDRYHSLYSGGSWHTVCPPKKTGTTYLLEVHLPSTKECSFEANLVNATIVQAIHLKNRHHSLSPSSWRSLFLLLVRNCHLEGFRRQGVEPVHPSNRHSLSPGGLPSWNAHALEANLINVSGSGAPLPLSSPLLLEGSLPHCIHPSTQTTGAPYLLEVSISSTSE